MAQSIIIDCGNCHRKHLYGGPCGSDLIRPHCGERKSLNGVTYVCYLPVYDGESHRHIFRNVNS